MHCFIDRGRWRGRARQLEVVFPLLAHAVGVGPARVPRHAHPPVLAKLTYDTTFTARDAVLCIINI